MGLGGLGGIIMAALRTEAEKAAIVRRCVEIEQAGGDVLAYLSSEHYITPRATWWNFQREWLHRRYPKDGKPRKEESMERFTLTPEMREKAIDIAINGGDPRPYLGQCGSESPNLMWIRIRTELKKEDPERWGKLPARVGRSNYGGRKKKPAEAQPETVAAEPVEEAPKPVKKPGTVPLNYDGYTVRCIEGELGRFYWDPKFNSLDWTTPEGEEISMGPDEWDRLISELPKIRAILGVAKSE